MDIISTIYDFLVLFLSTLSAQGLAGASRGESTWTMSNAIK
jgi:hypothetical protein